MARHARFGSWTFGAAALNTPLLGTLVAATVAIVAPQRAGAQTKDVEPYRVRVTQDNVYLRCGAGDPYYPVGKAASGDTLAVDGEDFGWLRVAYPEGVAALVPAGDANADPDGAAVQLVKPSSLLAYDSTTASANPVVASWQRLLTRTLPTGTRLRLLGTVNAENGDTLGYLVQAPDNARAFISASLCERLSATESAKARESNTAAQTNETAPPEPQSEPEPEPEPEPDTAPAATTITPARPEPLQKQPPAQDTNQTPAPTPTDSGANEPASGSQNGPTTATDDNADDDKAAKNTPADGWNDAEVPISALAPRLEEAYKSVINAALDTVELAPVLAEFRNATGRAGIEEGLATLWKRRLELLEIREGLQDALWRADAAIRKAAKDAGQLRSMSLAMGHEQPYAAVGRLTVSSVYDGERLPLLYRLVAVDSVAGVRGAAARAVAYVVPSETLRLDAKLGAIVGVIGAIDHSSTTKLPILRATNVDILTPDDE